MDFFEAQDRARRRTGRLLVLFLLALLGTIAALYAAALLLAGLTSRTATSYAPLWRPDLLAAVASFTVLVSGLAALFRWRQLSAGGPAIAELVGGRLVRPDTTDLRERTYLNIVEEMALASGLPVPAAYLLPHETAINAFAAGYSPHDAAVAITSGALDRLDRDELQGVVAHEFSHILNGDMRLNTRLSAAVFGILALSVVGRVLLRSLRHVRVSGSSRRGKGGGGGLIALAAAAGLALLLIGWIGHLFGRLIQAAVSRQREYLADAAAVQFTRHPAGLADALKKLAGTPRPGQLDAPRAAEISHYCFAQNFSSAFGGLFATHPPLSARIRALDPAWNGLPLSTSPALPAQPPTRPFPSRSTSQSMIDARHFPASAPLVAPVPSPAALDAQPASASAARAFLATLPDPLRAAAHDPALVAPLAYALALPHAAEPPSLASLFTTIEQHHSRTAARQTADLHAALASLPSAHRLPLLQLATPALRQLDPAACATLLATLHALVHADARLSPYEFALQKITTRAIGLAARPRDSLRVLAPNQVVAELSLALSAAARVAPADAPSAGRAFARAAMEFNGLQPPLAYRPSEAFTLDDLDAALDRLALTPAPFRKRILAALATALTADAHLTETEAALLHALAAALDCPAPNMTSA